MAGGAKPPRNVALWQVYAIAFSVKIQTSLVRLVCLPMTDCMMNSRPMLGGERFMTDKELCARLQLSRRTLQDYRNNGVIPYIQLGGKILYRESDIQKILMANYREAYRMKGV